MAEIINLNRARKARQKAGAKATAEANRALHGRSRADRDAEKVERERADRYIESHKREDDHD
jgi:hypothetical protein